MEVTQEGPFLVAERERFVARFPADPSRDLEQLQDQDIYVWSTDLVITPRPGITAMIEAIDGLVREGEIAQACQIIPDPVARKIEDG